MYFLGIDGGGTKTIFTLINKNGNLINSINKGSCHFSQIGFENLEILLKEGIEELLRFQKINKEDIEYSFLGLAGYGKVKKARPNIERVVSNVFKGLNYTLDSDIRVAIAGALGGKDGINIIAGTGSIGISINNENIKLCGGWGPSIGDEGSAYWIGKKTVQVFSKESDGRLKKGELYNIIKSELNIEDENSIITYLNDTIKNNRSEIAKLSELCYKAAINDDKNAINIFKEAGEELSLLIKVLIKEFNKDKITVSYTGGVFKSKDLILNPIKDNLNGYNINLIEPILEPHLGACLLAYIKSGNVVEEEFIYNLKKFN